MQETKEIETNEIIPPKDLGQPSARAGLTVARQADKILLSYELPTFGHTLTVAQAEKYVRALKKKIREIKRAKYAKK